jgi:hypothetical protein
MQSKYPVRETIEEAVAMCTSFNNFFNFIINRSTFNEKPGERKIQET